MDNILKKIISIFVVFAIATPLIVSQTVFPLVVGKAIWFRSMIWILTALWGLLIIRERKYLPEQNFAFLLFGLVVLFQIISALAGYNLINSFWTNLERMNGIVQSVHLLIFSLILFSIFKSFKEWLFILRSIALVGLLVSFFGFLESFGIFLPYALNIPLNIATLNQNYSSLGSTLGNSVYLSWYLSIIIFIVTSLIFYDIKSKGISLVTLSEKTSILNILALFFSFWCVFYNFSRGTILSITLGVIFIVVITLLKSRYKKLKILLVVFLSILFIGTIFILIIIPRIEDEFIELRKTIVLNNVPELIGIYNEGYDGEGTLRLNNMDYNSKVNTDLREKIIGNSLQESELCRGEVLFEKWLMGLSGQFRECTATAIALKKIPGNFTESVIQGYNFGGRERAIKTGFESWKSSPIFGIGPHNFSIAHYKNLTFEDYISSKSNMDDPHNSIIKVLTEVGSLGLVSVVVFLGYIFFISYKKSLISTNRYFWLSISACLVTYFISSLLQVSTLSNQILLMVLIGLVARSSVGFEAKSNLSKLNFNSNKKFNFNYNNMQFLYVIIIFPILIFVLNYHSSIYELARNTDKDINVSENWDINKNQKNINSFPALSQWPRMEMIKKINANFDILIMDKSYKLLDQVIVIVDSEYESTKNLSPDNYIAMLDFGFFYFEAAKYRPILAKKLKIITEDIEYLSPNIHPTLGMKINYSIIDRNKEKFTELHREWKEKLKMDQTRYSQETNNQTVDGIYDNPIDDFDSYAESFN